MELKDLTCDHCGAKLQVNPDDKKVTCEYCGSELKVSALIRKEAEGKKEKAKINWKRELLDWAIIIVAAVIMAWALTHFVVMKTEVVSESMVATLNKGDRIVANRLAYLFSSPKRGDIIFFPFPDDTSDEPEIFVKRVIGLPGDKVEIKGGRVYINDSDTPLKEDYLYEEPDDEDCGPFMVPEGCYFMMGDNRNISHDSRYWDNTFVTEDKIEAKAWLRYKPGLQFYSRPDYGE